MRLSGWGSSSWTTVPCERRQKKKKGRTFLWESWDVGSTIPTSTQSASGIIQEQRVSAETGHRCWWNVSKTLLYVGDNRRVVGVDVRYSCKQVQNLQPTDDVILTAEDIQYGGKIVMKLWNLVSYVTGRISAESVRERGAEEDRGFFNFLLFFYLKHTPLPMQYYMLWFFTIFTRYHLCSFVCLPYLHYICCSDIEAWEGGSNRRLEITT
jgi:hypothetical protein